MSLQLTSEQVEFQKSFARFLSDSVTSEYRRTRMDQEKGSDANFTAALEDFGLFPIFAENDPELSVGFRELALIAFEEGRALVPEKIAEPVLAGPFFVSRILSDESRNKCALESDELAAILSGKSRVAIVPKAGLQGVEVSDDESGKLTGTLHFVERADESDFFLLQVKDSRWLLMQKHEGSLRVEREPSLDLTLRLYQIECSGSPFVSLDSDSSSLLTNAYLLTRALEIAGLCTRGVAMTSEYVKTRKQFDVPIGGFQAVQHQLVDMKAQTEALRALAFFGSWTFDHSPEQFPLSALSAVLKAGEIGPWVLEKAIQLHGGIGFTWEYDLHFYLRRARAFQILHAFGIEEQRALLNAVH